MDPTTGKNIYELLTQGLNLFTPVVDRWSPIAYSIGLWIHRDVGNHSGFETTYRHSLNFCYVTHGLSLFEEIGKACMHCCKLRTRFIQSSMCPRDPSSLFAKLWRIGKHRLREQWCRLVVLFLGSINCNWYI